jgi:hypothetical protein
MNKSEETFSTLAGTLRPTGGTRSRADQPALAPIKEKPGVSD